MGSGSQAVALVTSVRASMERGDTALESSVEIRALLEETQTREQWLSLTAVLAALAAGLLGEDWQEFLQRYALEMLSDG